MRRQPPGIPRSPAWQGIGTPVVPTVAVRALIVFGMVMGVTGVGALFAVGGAVAGAAVGVLAETPARKTAAQATKA